MEKLIAVNIIFAVFIGFGVLYLIVELIRLRADISNKNEYIKLALIKINQARYGNFQITLPDVKDDKLKLYKSLNNLFESIYDRDLVINEYREKEKEHYHMIEEFTAALTHDLKVPVIAQDKTCDLLIHDKFGELNEQQREVILKLKESNKELKEMINSILEAYKTNEKGVEPNIEKNINVCDFIKNEMLETLTNLASSYGKKLEFHSIKENIIADFDKLLIKRVISNLVLNGISHSYNTDKIDICLNKTGDTFSIDVIDYGEGIEEDDIKKIFNKYYSVAKKGNKVSTGLGLYLSDKIIKKHKGIIEVESKKGEGSIFRVILPLVQEVC